MNTLIKRLVLGLLAIIVIVGVIGTVLIKNLDLNLHKDKIQQVVLDKTGRELQINGEISASLFPWVGLSLNEVTLANAPDFGEEAFAEVVSSDVKVELLPLIGGNLNVNVVELHGLKLNLRIAEDGRTNWEDLMSTTAVVETSNGADDIVQEVEAGAPVVAALSVGGLVVTDAHVQWTDLKAGSDVTLKAFNLSTDAIQLSEPFHFDTDFSVASSSVGVASEVVASGELNLNLTDNVYSLSDLKITTNATGDILPVDRLQATLGGNLVTDLNAQTFDLTSFSADIAGVPVTGEVHGTGLMGAPGLFGQLRSTTFDAAKILDQLAISLPDNFNRQLLSETNFAVRFQQGEDQLLINDVVLATGGIELNGDFQLTNLAQSPVVSGTLVSNTFNPGPWAQSFGIEASDPLVMQRAQLRAAVRQSGQLLSLNDLTFVLDDFTLQGNVEVNDINAPIPAVKFALQGTSINVDRYLPVAQITEGETPQVPTDTSSTALIPVALIGDLEIDGEVTLEQLTVSGISVENIILPLVSKDGRLEIKEARAALYGGNLFSTLSMDVAGQEPLLTLSTNLNGVQAEPFLADYLKDTSPLSGTGIISIDLLSRGETVDGLLARSSGAITTRFTDGALIGVNIGHEVRRAQALITGSQLAAVESEVKTDFTELSVSAEIANGVLQSDDLSFKSPLMRLSGSGGVNLSAKTIDYLLQVMISATTEGQGGKELSELNGLNLPVPIRGSFTDLSVDFTGMLINGLKSDLVDQLRAGKDKLLNEQKAVIAETLKQEEAAVKARVEQERANAEAKLQEQQQLLREQAEQKKQQLQQQLEEEKDQLKNKFEKNLKKGLSDLLGG